MAFKRRFRKRRYVKRRRSSRFRRSSMRRRNPIIRRSLFRSRGRIRKHNTGVLNVNSIMRYGQSLPQTAFGPCKFVVASQQHILHGVVNNNNPSSPGYPPNDGRRTLLLSNLVSPYGWWQDSQLPQYIRCYGLYRLLYKRYIVLGAKVKIRLQPGILPLRYQSAAGEFRIPAAGPPFGQVNVAAPGGVTELGQRVWDQVTNNVSFSLLPGLGTYNPFLNTNPNIYWYVRVCLNTFTDNGNVANDPDLQIGHPMLTNSLYNTSYYVNTLGEYQAVPWESLTDFLGDRTVAYSRDRRRWTTNDGPTASGFHSSDVGLGSSFFQGTFSSKTGATTLRYNYSLKKLIKDKNPLRFDSPFWRSLDEPRLSQYATSAAPIENFPRQEVTLRYGCVWFDPTTGRPQFHYPFPIGFMAQTEINYYCAWRDPVNIDTLNDPALGDPSANLSGSAMELSTMFADRRKLKEILSKAQLQATLEEDETNLPLLEGDLDKVDDEDEEEYSEGQESESDYPESEIEEELLQPSLKRSRIEVKPPQPVPRQVE